MKQMSDFISPCHCFISPRKKQKEKIKEEKKSVRHIYGKSINKVKV